jgi:hypothetical protein
MNITPGMVAARIAYQAIIAKSPCALALTRLAALLYTAERHST